MKKISNRSFTLLEMFLVIFFLGIASSLVGIKVHALLERYSFNHNVEKLRSHMQFCQNMAVANQADVFVDFYSSEKKISIKSGMGGNQGFFLGQAPQKDVLTGVILQFDGEEKPVFHLILSSNHQRYPLSIITLLDKQSKHKTSIKWK